MKIENIVVRKFFKCVNTAMRSSFKEKFAEIRTCGSHEQCTRLHTKNAAPAQTQTRLYPN